MSDKTNDGYEETESNEEGYEYESESEGHGETIIDKPTIDGFFDTENILYSMEKTMRGYQKQNGKWVPLLSDPIARDEFINLTINSLRSIVNPENIITKKTAEDVEMILLEKNVEFIDVVEDESPYSPQIEIYFESLINMHDHILELFLGLVVGGHGAQTLKEIYAGVAKIDNQFNNAKEDSTFRLAVGDKDLINIGMRGGR